VAAGDQFAGQFGKGLHLGAGDAEFRAAQARVAGGATQTGELREDVETRLRLRRRVERRVDLVRRLAAQGFVVRGFGGFRGDGQDQFGARRQVLQHFGLGSPQDEGADQTLEDVLRLAVAVALDRAGEAFVEAVDAAEQPGVGKAHDRPEVGEAVFDRRSGHRQAEVGREVEDRLRALGRRVLDRLRFIGDDGVPACARRNVPAPAAARCRRRSARPVVRPD
jgi:BMFP domain-containing protein YqiC